MHQKSSRFSTMFVKGYDSYRPTNRSYSTLRNHVTIGSCRRLSPKCPFGPLTHLRGRSDQDRNPNSPFSTTWSLQSRFAHNMASNSRIAVTSEEAPKPLPFLSSGLVVGNIVYCSGQVGVDPATGKMVEGTVQDRTVYARAIHTTCPRD